MGAPSVAKPLLMAWVACDSDTPSGRLKEMVEAGDRAWWLDARGAEGGSEREKSLTGTCGPVAPGPAVLVPLAPGVAVPVTYTLRSVSGLCQYSGAASMTTWYWFSGW